MVLQHLRLRSHERRNELIPVWDFKPAWIQVLFTWSFISDAFQNDPIFWWMHFISGSIYMIFYHPKWNFISAKVTDMKSILFWVSFRLNACEHVKRVDWIPKWGFQPKWNLIPVWVHFASHVNVLLLVSNVHNLMNKSYNQSE